jgi:hypothetical protein
VFYRRHLMSLSWPLRPPQFGVAVPTTTDAGITGKASVIDNDTIEEPT